jgi:hypothetical protein
MIVHVLFITPKFLSVFLLYNDETNQIHIITSILYLLVDTGLLSPLLQNQTVAKLVTQI